MNFTCCAVYNDSRSYFFDKIYECVSWCSILDESYIKLAASWLDGVGTTLSAIGNTPIQFASEQFLFNIDLVGDVMQANSAAILADLEEEYNLSKIGNIIDSSGNVTEIAGNVMRFPDFTYSGNAIQTVGTGLTFVDALMVQETYLDLYYIYGSLIQTIGLSLQTLAGKFPLGNKFGERVNTIGTWIQAVGSNIEAIGVTLKFSHAQKPTAVGYGAVGFYSMIK